MQQQLAEIRRMHAERAAKARSQAADEPKPAEKKTGKVIGGKYFANPPSQLGMKEYEEIVNRYQRIQRQKASRVVKRFDIDEKTAAIFQSFAVKHSNQKQRIAIMYGTVEEGGVVRCHCCYEPEQDSKATHFELLQDKRQAKVDALAAAMGYQRVGVLVTTPYYKLDDPILCGREVCVLAEQMAKHGLHCCLVQVRLTSDLTSFNIEAYQLSEQCVDVWKEGTLSPHPTEGKFIHSERVLEAVQEEDRAGGGGKKQMVTKESTQDVDTIWFTVPIAIGNFQSDVGNMFIRLNRPGEAPPTWENVGIFLRDPKRSGKRFVEAVYDFPLMVFLLDTLDVKSDIPLFVKACQNKDSQAMANYETLIKAGCQLI